MDADPDDKSRQYFGLKLCIKCVARRRSGECRTAGAFDMVVLRTGSIPEYHDGVANELIDSPPFGDERLGQSGEMSRGLLHQNVGICCFSDSSEIFHVGEKNCHFSPEAAEFR